MFKHFVVSLVALIAVNTLGSIGLYWALTRALTATDWLESSAGSQSPQMLPMPANQNKCNAWEPIHELLLNCHHLLSLFGWVNGSLSRRQPRVEELKDWTHLWLTAIAKIADPVPHHWSHHNTTSHHICDNNWQLVVSTLSTLLVQVILGL